ncbi:MAG: TIGR04255 family protein [Candidatus Sulfotelmatobacter sp.]
MPNYKKAPITEALIDIRVELSSELRFEDLQAVKKHISSDYPQEETRSLAEGIIQFGPSLQASAQQKPWGLMFRNEGNNQVLQVRLDGFTFSRLEPYEDFEHLRDEAKRLWDIYRELVRPKRVTRVAVRYINQLIIPGARVEPGDYLNIFPYVSDELPSEFRDFGPFLMRLPMYQHDLKGLLVLNEATTAPRLPNTIALVLDLDLYVESPPVTNEQELWEFFDRLRERKNLYFEACITDKTRELIS